MEIAQSNGWESRERKVTEWNHVFRDALLFQAVDCDEVLNILFPGLKLVWKSESVQVEVGEYEPHEAAIVTGAENDDNLPKQLQKVSDDHDVENLHVLSLVGHWNLEGNSAAS